MSVRRGACGAAWVLHSIINAVQGTELLHIGKALCLRLGSFLHVCGILQKSGFLSVPAGTGTCIDFALTSGFAPAQGTATLH